MASFARSFKHSPYLSPRRRPQMPGRTLSNSSDLSLASHSDDVNEIISSTPSSPAGPKPTTSDHDWVSTKDPTHASSVSATSITTSATSSFRNFTSRPIAIELPKESGKKLPNSSKSSVYTPPEPLSARGDLPGGYFPLHEDPAARVRRTHPFQSDARPPRPKFPGLISEPSLKAPTLGCGQGTPQQQSMTSSNTPVASYMPSGLQDSSLPMGKYYPSNYESRSNRQSLRSSIVVPMASAYIDEAASKPPALSPSDSDTRRRMQQYQRDIVAQAALVLGGSGNAKMSAPPQSLPIREASLSYNLHKPRAPKIQPLGSPGPVTPMDLESSSASSYLDRGRNASDSSRHSSSPLSSSANALAAQLC